MTNDGLVFTSIDDNELHHLRKICDEIFNENQFSGSNNPNSQSCGRDYKQVALTNEYLWFSFLQSQNAVLNEIPKDIKFKHTDSQGGCSV